MNGDRSTGFFGRVTGRGADRTPEADARAAGDANESADARGQRGPNEPRADADSGRTDQPGTGDPRSAGSAGDPRSARTTGSAGSDARTHDHGAAHSDAKPKSDPYQGDPGDGLAEFAAELKLLAEAVLERVEPVLRRAADGQVEWSSCDWCPVCAAAALVRGEHHEVLQSVADHGTAIVTVLREALAGVPVDPVMPEHDHAAPHRDSTASPHDAAAGRTEDRAGQRPSRSRYVAIPVTIKA
ncbi:hypothetical protein [Nocardia brasiliensis]|uniref:hypothetical protein n=1 Tax=Nocardia brasiliensis TaxID=37326 RepID=UPI000A79C9AE|nr:hypothetical protein [Nocardia brasiliensis]